MSLAEPGFTKSDQPIDVDAHATLAKGPAFAEIAALTTSAAESAYDWPTYRHDARRSGATACEVADDQHAVTQGLDDFEIIDEGYVLHGDYDGQGTVLLSVDHEDAMDQVAWARQEGDCRVFCLSLGHDNVSWSNPGFRETLRRGITWSAGRTL